MVSGNFFVRAVIWRRQIICKATVSGVNSKNIYVIGLNCVAKVYDFDSVF